MQYKETEYLYSSARVRAMESYMIGRDAVARMVDMADTEEVINAMSDKGINIVRKADPISGADVVDIEATLTEMVSRNFSTIEEIAPNTALVHILRYVYDCNNIKAAIKANILGLSDLETIAMMIDIGTIPVSDVVSMPTEKNYLLLPENMAKNAQVAYDAYSATKDPRKIDLILDRACYNDMLAASNELGCRFIIDFIRTKIDFVNYMVTLRVARISSNVSERSLLYEGLIGGGRIPEDRFIAAFDSEDTEEMLDMLLIKNGYEKFISKTDGQNTLSSIEKRSDNYQMEILREAKKVSFGAEPLFAYLVAAEYIAKNVRIIIAGKEADLERSVIGERVRDCYV